jgi:hypothetical protein
MFTKIAHVVTALLLLLIAAPDIHGELVVRKNLTVPHMAREEVRLEEGQTVQISAHMPSPSRLPPNARLRVRWTLENADDPHRIPRGPEGESKTRQPHDFGIPKLPTASWSKVLHALDADVFLVYRAPASGIYELSVTPEPGEIDLFDLPRWREDQGAVGKVFAPPRAVAWPDGAKIHVAIAIESIDLHSTAKLATHVECEPNDTPEQAQPIPLRDTGEGEGIHVLGSADDVEYFDNGHVGQSGDDWFRFDFQGAERRLLTMCLSIPDQQVLGQLRCYRLDTEKGPLAAAPGELLAIAEYADGQNPNERAHQQTETHRTAINRWVDPGKSYLLRVEANTPAYDLELRVVRPAPFDDPRQAVRHGIYDHLGQVDAWLTNRPRGATVERRIRHVGNILGENCMSCHTQSGVWGPSVPFALGYRPQNVQAWRHLVNVCYQSMRPTNDLIDAANNTSLRPFDIGDGPAGTRVAGHAVTSLERYLKPRKLQSKQAIRAANYVMQTHDPGGINAAGPGANVGSGVVFNYAGEIVWHAWNATSELKYFHKLEEKARKSLDMEPKYTDDLGHRIELFGRYFPRNYPAAVQAVSEEEELGDADRQKRIDDARKLDDRIRTQIDADLARLRAIQLDDGAWGFDPGTSADGSKTWTVKDKKADPSPTALALIAFQAAGFGPDDPTVSRGIDALMRLQHPTGFWKIESGTGFVSTSYALHALARFYPVRPARIERKDFEARASENLVESIRRVRALSMTDDPALVDLMAEAANHSSPLVRYWAMIGLGAIHTDAGLGPIMRGVGDASRMVREAAHWGLRQSLIDDRGWDLVFKALETGDDTTRETVMRALVMKIDGVLTQSSVGWERLTRAFDRGFNEDPHPGVRAWAMKAAWQWWIWNPPVREAINAAWIRLLQRPESNAIVENTLRYQSHALFTVNGHVANGTGPHQYKQLQTLVDNLYGTFRVAQEEDAALTERLTQRLIGIASTFYGYKGGDGGPGQLGYTTAGAGALFGDAVLASFKRIESFPSDSPEYDRPLQLTLMAAANIPHKGLQQKLTTYALEGPEQFRSIASTSLSDPKLVKLAAVPEKLEPMVAQLIRGALEPPRRAALSDPLLKLFQRASWIVPDHPEQRAEIVQYLLPDVSRFRERTEIDAMEDATARAEADKWYHASWYLASGMGVAIAENPDLHFIELAESFPPDFTNAAEAQLWLRSVPWILSFEREIPEVDADELPPVDAWEELRTRALSLFLTQLGDEVNAHNRTTATVLAHQTALRRNPEIHAALETLLTFEKDKNIIETAQKVLSTHRDSFVSELRAAIKKENVGKFEVDDEGNPILPEGFVSDFAYFRDHVVPELGKTLRLDERSCLACHGHSGRTPMDLQTPDAVGYLSVERLLVNYRTLQARIDLSDIEKSKLLRKPLNVQTGEEDGHQGGRRYQPMDRGYQILRRWVLNQKIMPASGNSQAAF